MLVVVSLVPTTAAGAADETCNGVPATIVGTPGGRVFGTPLDDVIVSNGAEYVDGADGNDLICTTNTPAHKSRAFSVSGGRGENVIDRRSPTVASRSTSISRHGRSRSAGTRPTGSGSSRT